MPWQADANQHSGGSRRQHRDPGGQEETHGSPPRCGSPGGKCSAPAAGSLFIPFTLRSGKAPAQGGKKPFEGVTLNISCWSATYPKLIADYLPEFTEKTGIKVNYDTPGFPVYNQRADLELSTKGSGFDVLNVTFIYTSRWIGAGWLTPLDAFIKDPEQTPADWDFADFLPGSVQPMRDKAGAVYGIPWISDVLMAARRPLRFVQGQRPRHARYASTSSTTPCRSSTRRTASPAYRLENHWGWIFIPFLQGFGGNVFRNPPDDLMPALDTPGGRRGGRVLRQADQFLRPGGRSRLHLRPGHRGAARRPHQLRAAQPRLPARCSARTAARSPRRRTSPWCPKGPKGRFPGVASHGWGIPVGAKNKDASWEFIKWSLSKDLILRLTQKHGLGSVTRKSLIELCRPTSRGW